MQLNLTFSILMTLGALPDAELEAAGCLREVTAKFKELTGIAHEVKRRSFCQASSATPFIVGGPDHAISRLVGSVGGGIMGVFDDKDGKVDGPLAALAAVCDIFLPVVDPAHPLARGVPREALAQATILGGAGIITGVAYRACRGVLSLPGEALEALGGDMSEPVDQVELQSAGSGVASSVVQLAQLAA